jgi:membrane fusion protein (multidrug efflux system)
MNETVREAQIRTADVATSTSGARPRRSMRRLFLFALVLIAICGAGLYGRYWWIQGRWLETTDDAYVGGDTTTLSPQVAGQIVEVLVGDNQKVSAGDVLVRIDPRPFRAALARAVATVQQQEAALQNLRERRELQGMAIDQAQSDLSAKTAAAIFTGQEVDRYKALAQSDAGSKQNAQKAVAADEQAKAGVAGSRAGLAAANQQIKVLESQIAETQAVLAGAQADLATARLNLSFTEIRSPIDGYVGNRAARVGAYLSAGTYVMSVVPSHGLWVDANFKEDQLRRMKSGQRVSVTADVNSDHVLHGRIASLAPATGAVFSVIPPENATGNFTKIVQRVPVRILLEDNDSAPFSLRPGLSAAVAVDTRPE